MNCAFLKAWIGQCKEEVVEGKTFCKSHDVSCLCGKPAVKDCDWQVLGLMCGTPICGDACKHRSRRH